MLKRRSKPCRPNDLEARNILASAMASVGADPALVFAFRKTGVYLSAETEARRSKAELKAFDAALDEYYESLSHRHK